MPGTCKPVEPRFWARVAKAGDHECWEWTGSKTPVGYGKIHALGKPRMAHRVSIWLATGADLDGKFYVCHTCDNPGCVNPAHLWIGNNSENILDAYSKGRMVSQRHPERLSRGEEHGYLLAKARKLRLSKVKWE